MAATGDDLNLFRYQLSLRRYNDSTLSILQYLLVCRDVPSLTAIRSLLKDVLRAELSSVLTEISSKTADVKLGILEFFVSAFELAGDTESCLAVKYEALVFRDDSSSKNAWLGVSCDEWLTLGEDAFANGYHAIAIKCCENAMTSTASMNTVDQNGCMPSAISESLHKVKLLRDVALAAADSRSVQAQATEFMKKKMLEADRKLSLLPATGDPTTASCKFRTAIRRRNARQLEEHRRINRDMA